MLQRMGSHRVECDLATEQVALQCCVNLCDTAK